MRSGPGKRRHTSALPQRGQIHVTVNGLNLIRLGHPLFSKSLGRPRLNGFSIFCQPNTHASMHTP